jgi:hypothetical protein
MRSCALHTAPLTASCGCTAAVPDADGSDLENESNTTAYYRCCPSKLTSQKGLHGELVPFPPLSIRNFAAPKLGAHVETSS